jgi:hypothetical protein
MPVIVAETIARAESHHPLAPSSEEYRALTGRNEKGARFPGRPFLAKALKDQAL